MSVKGFKFDGSSDVQKYDYNALDNLPENVSWDTLEGIPEEIINFINYGISYYQINNRPNLYWPLSLIGQVVDADTVALPIVRVENGSTNVPASEGLLFTFSSVRRGSSYPCKLQFFVDIYSAGLGNTYYRTCNTLDASNPVWSDWVKRPKKTMSPISLDKTLIQNGDDLNDYLTPGQYRSISGGSSSVTNSPVTTSFYLDVIQSANAGHTYQRLVTDSGTSPNIACEEYIRDVYQSSFGTTYNAWVKLPTRSEITNIQSDISALNSNMPVEITGLTSAYGTVDAKCYKIGKVVTLAAKIELTSDVPANADVLSGFPIMAFQTNYAPVPVLNNTTKEYLMLDIVRRATSGNNGALSARTAIASGASLRVSTTFCANE